MRGVILLLVTLSASVAFAQEDGYAPDTPAPSAQDDDYPEDEYDKEAAKRLEGTSRISIMGGWRYAPNLAFYDKYYSAPTHRDLERSRGSIGGPLLTGTFGYSVTELIEVGIDLFATYERMQLTNEPGLNIASYGALVGVRLQKRFELGSGVVIPSLGALAGPHIAASYFDGGRAVEQSSTAFGLCGGATVKFSKKWGLTFELRHILAPGDVEDVGGYNAGGTWLSVGMTYSFPWKWDDKRIRGRL